VFAGLMPVRECPGLAQAWATSGPPPPHGQSMV
jgi:hypothetical protein